MATNVIILSDPVNGTTHDIAVEAYRVTVKRGRDRELDEINAGTCVIEARNYDGNFNPYFSESNDFILLETGIDFLLQEDEAQNIPGGRFLLESGGIEGGTYGVLAPGRQIVIRDVPAGSDGVTVFTGFTDDFDYDWKASKFTNVSIACIDGIGLLARQKYPEWTAVDGQLSGVRVQAALAQNLADTQWAANLVIEAGNSTLQDDTISFGTTVLSYLQTVARTEHGRLFVTRDNQLWFQDRTTLATTETAVTFSDTGDSGTVPFSEIEVSFGSELLYNRVSIQRVGGTEQTASDGGSIGNYRQRDLVYTGLLFDSDEQAEDLAHFLVGKYATPEAVVSAITVKLDKLPLALREAVLALEIGDPVELQWTPTEGGAELSQDLVVEGVMYQAGTDEATLMTFQLSPANAATGFILDSDVFGVLDESILGF